MIAFFVGSIYQLVSVIAIKKAFFPNDKADVFFQPKVSSAQINAIKEIGGFNSVTYVDLPQKTLSIPFLKSLHTVLWRRWFAKKIVANKVYTHFFAPNLYSQALLYYGYISRANPEVALFFHDEGMSGYSDIWIKSLDTIESKHNFSFWVKCYLNFCNVSRVPIGKLMARAQGMYVFSKKLSESYLPWDLTEIPYGDEMAEHTCRLYKALYSDIDLSEYAKCEAVFLGTHMLNNKSFNDEQNKLADEAGNLFGKAMILKPHPGDRKGIYLGGLYAQEHRNFPIELLTTNVDINKKIFITDSSSAMFSFYYLFIKRRTSF